MHEEEFIAHANRKPDGARGSKTQRRVSIEGPMISLASRRIHREEHSAVGKNLEFVVVEVAVAAAGSRSADADVRIIGR